jgi:transposase
MIPTFTTEVSGEPGPGQEEPVMPDRGPQNPPSGGRRRKRFLSPSQKYEIWLGLLRGESTISEAADRAGVDRWTVMKLRLVAKQGALDALAASRPGVRPVGVDAELAEARAEIARLSEALKEMGIRLMLAEGKGRWD